MARETIHYSVKRTVPGAPPSWDDSFTLLSTRIQTLDLPLKEDKRRGWKPYPIFRGSTRCVTHLSCHVSVLNPGKTPHEPHEHKEEELLIVLSGEPDLVIVDTKPVLTERRYGLRPGPFVFIQPINGTPYITPVR